MLTEPIGMFCPQAAELVSRNWEAYEAHMRDVRDYLEARLEVSDAGSCLSLPSRGLILQSAWPGARVDMSLWPCHLLTRTELLVIPECSQSAVFSRLPLGSRGSTSTATLQAPSDSATPLTSPSLVQAFKVALLIHLCHALSPPLPHGHARGAEHLPHTALCS